LGEVGACSFHVVGGVGVSLLSLIPRLIRHRVPVWGMVWVWLGGTLLLLWFRTCESGLGTLLGPEETFACAGVFLVRLLAGFPNALLWVWWCWWLGVWLCVECCIVDASILLWSSV
jgi:hypothetical protein